MRAASSMVAAGPADGVEVSGHIERAAVGHSRDHAGVVDSAAVDDKAYVEPATRRVLAAHRLGSVQQKRARSRSDIRPLLLCGASGSIIETCPRAGADGCHARNDPATRPIDGRQAFKHSVSQAGLRGCAGGRCCSIRVRCDAARAGCTGRREPTIRSVAPASPRGAVAAAVTVRRRCGGDEAPVQGRRLIGSRRRPTRVLGRDRAFLATCRGCGNARRTRARALDVTQL